MLKDSEVQRILAVLAHPDDVDFGAGGTIARWTDEGIEVTYCLVTDGDAGGFDRSVARAEIPEIRRTSSVTPPRRSAWRMCASLATRTGGWSSPSTYGGTSAG